MKNNARIAVVGAGLGGLAAAACLMRAGFEVKVYEQAPVLGEVGAGIQLSANATSVLRSLGLQSELDAVGVRPLSYDFCLFNTAERLQGFALGDDHEARFGAPYYQLHRADLHEILVRCVSGLSSNAIELNKSCVGFEEGPDEVTLRFSDGSTATADLLVGADGIKSAVLEQLVGPQAPRFTGQSAWRIVVPANQLP